MLRFAHAVQALSSRIGVTLLSVAFRTLAGGKNFIAMSCDATFH
jgi:hypothetical protein